MHPRHQARFDIYAQHGVLILPEDMALTFQPEDDTVLIRIKGHEFKTLAVDGYVARLHIMFGDTENGMDGQSPMTEAQARNMVEFMDKYRGKKLVVHCLAGISRSSATAKAWAYMNGNQELMDAIDQCPTFMPNKLVFGLLKAEIDRRERLGL